MSIISPSTSKIYFSSCDGYKYSETGDRPGECVCVWRRARRHDYFGDHDLKNVSCTGRVFSKLFKIAASKMSLWYTGWAPAVHNFFFLSWGGDVLFFSTFTTREKYLFNFFFFTSRNHLHRWYFFFLGEV